MDKVPTRRQKALPTRALPNAGVSLVLGGPVLEHFEIFEVNEGGFGYVLGLIDLRTGEKIAAKIPKTDRDSASSLEEFIREVSIWIELPPHVNIVKARCVREIQGSLVLLMDYVEGTSFRTVRELLKIGRPSPQTTIDFGCQVCLGMEAANRDRQVVHMDLKPENLLVERGEIVKITDFGLAHRVRVTNGAYERRYAGSWPYAAPERFADEPCDPRSDIYSLGVILYEMLTGEFPYPFELADDPAEAYMQLRDFHAAGGMSRIISSLYYQGIHGANREIGEVLSIFLSPFRSERSPGFGHALRLMRRLGAKPRPIPVERLTLAEQLARAEGLQMVGRHS